MVAFVAVYRGKTLSDAEFVGVTIRRELVSKAVDAIPGDLVLSRLHEARGDLVAALAAVRRRQYPPYWGLDYLSTFLRDEARLAALTGDREGAINAYQHYLALRSDPEPLLQADANAARAELARLLKEGG